MFTHLIFTEEPNILKNRKTQSWKTHTSFMTIIKTGRYLNRKSRLMETTDGLKLDLYISGQFIFDMGTMTNLTVKGYSFQK